MADPFLYWSHGTCIPPSFDLQFVWTGAYFWNRNPVISSISYLMINAFIMYQQYPRGALTVNIFSNAFEKCIKYFLSHLF